MTEQEQISLRQAVDIATKTIRELYPEEALEDLLLEEIYYWDADQEWEVTLGFSRPYSTQRPGAVTSVFPQAKPRSYKRFKINANTGEVRGMLDGTIDTD
jgi:hypothetical protein